MLLTFNDMIADQVKGAEDASELESGTDPQALVREAIERLVDYDDWFVREARKAWRRSSAARR